jgi:hypothetical protein
MIEVTVVSLLGDTGEVRAAAQLVLFPILVVLIGQLSFFRQRVPVFLLVLSCGFVLVAALARGGVSHRQPGVFLLARFEGDRLGAETNIVANRIRALDGEWRPDLIQTAEQRISSANEARDLLASDGTHSGIAYGSSRWLDIVLQQFPSRSLSSFQQGSAAAGALRDFGLPDLEVVSSVPSVSLSFASDPGSVEYIARLAVIWGSGSQALISADEDHRLEAEVLRINSIKSLWTTAEPIVFARWMYGTYYLARALSASSEQGSGEVQCAVRALRVAYSELARGERPALEAAIVNNQVIAEIVGYDATQTRRQVLEDALQRLRKARTISKLQNSAGMIRRVLEKNISYIKGALHDRE